MIVSLFIYLLFIYTISYLFMYVIEFIIYLILMHSKYIDKNSVQSYMVSIHFEFEIFYNFGRVKMDMDICIYYVHTYV